MKKRHIVVLILFLQLLGGSVSYAQCAMCKATTESAAKEGSKRAKGLNDGILYLLAAPYVLVGGVAVLWWRKYRKKESSVQPQ